MLEAGEKVTAYSPEFTVYIPAQQTKLFGTETKVNVVLLLSSSIWLQCAQQLVKM